MSVEYENPILYGDLSDPDVIRVGEYFYMISSSFTYVPGIPVMRSRDLKHWERIGYAAERLPHSRYERPAHRCGLFAPSIRYHDSRFYVYVCMPDEGLYAFTAEDPARKWDAHLVKRVTGWIDPCPLFDEDGRVYLVHGFAGSRVGINNVLYVHALSPDGMRVLDLGKRVYDGAEHGDSTVEGPKIYKRDGEYWILCPAGGVTDGYQLALRSRSVYGPYERRVVLSRGDTPVNGPHQGGLVSDGQGGEWFIHFQDLGVYGRVPHLQPVTREDGWPVMGKNGFPVPGGRIPLEEAPAELMFSDEFEDGPGLQWQWQANPRAEWAEKLCPGLRLHAYPAETLFSAPHFLSQMMPCRDFDMTQEMDCSGFRDGDRAGIAVMGFTYHYLAAEKGRAVLVSGCVTDRDQTEPSRAEEKEIASAEMGGSRVCLRLSVRNGTARFFIGEDKASLAPVGPSLPMEAGGWTGARPGIFALNTRGEWGGYADIRRVRFDRL